MCTAGHSSLAASNLLIHGDFEGPFRMDGVPQSWRNGSHSSWGAATNLEVAFARETNWPHGGQACLRITCSRLGYITAKRQGWVGFGAAVATPTRPIPLEPGRIFRVRLWLRGTPQIAVRALVRQSHRPWSPYFEHHTVLTGTWQPVEFLFTSRWHDTNSAFQVAFADIGTVWLDDVSIAEVSTAEARAVVASPPHGNLLHNGGFDLGKANWLPEFGWDTVHDPEYAIENDADGPCLRVTSAPAVGLYVLSDVVPVAPGYPIRIACRIRLARLAQVRFAALWQDANHVQIPHCETYAHVGTEWQRLEASGEVPFVPHTPHAFILVHVKEPNTLWIDDVELRQDVASGPDTRPRAAIMTDRHPAALYLGHERPMLQVVSFVPECAQPARLAWWVEDFHGRLVMRGTWRPGPGRQTRTISGAHLPQGWYRGTVTWQHAGRDWRNECTFCILPPAARLAPAATSPFGAHARPTRKYYQLMSAVGVRWFRLWPPGYALWETVEPEPGRWVWHDEEVQTLAREYGLRLVGMLESPPAWVNAAAPDYWEKWENYVARVVEHFRDDIHVWEVQNEPDLKWWLSKPEGPSRAQNHADYLRHTYPVIKRIDPTATVLGGSGVGTCYLAGSDSAAFTDELIEAGGLQWMDAFSFHFYHAFNWRQPLDELADPVPVSAERLRARMRQAGKVVPLINSEGGVYNPGPAVTYRPPAPDNCAPLPPQEVARLLVRMYVVQIAAGIERFFYYNCCINGTPCAKAWDSFIEGDGQPRPAVAAYAVLTWALDGAHYLRTVQPTPDTWVYHFETPKGPLAVVWSRTGTTTEMALPDAVEAWNLVGTPVRPGRGGRFEITPDPLYVRLKQRHQ